jgi:oligopeptide transport system ATP-binding protein
MTPLIEVRNLTVHYPLGGGRTLRAVDVVSFEIPRGQTLGLVGESGCGKSTTGRALLRLQPATAGSVTYEGIDLFAVPGGAPLRRLRQRMQMVFQDPYGSLSPRMTIGRIVAEPLEIHGIGRSRGERAARVAEILAAVGLPSDAAERYPHEFSGGQRQRIGIARALVLDPEFIVLDEPVSALDISVRAQIVNLLTDLQRERSLTYLFVGHDLSLIRHVADTVAVMYLGRIVEIASALDLYANPRHPYTRSLFDAVPVADPSRRRARASLEGDPPSPADLPGGCRFRTRCAYAQEVCAQGDPPFAEIGDGLPPHRSACHFALTLPMWSPAAG